MTFTRILGALALSIAFALPAAAARINVSATAFADPGDPIAGFLGPEIFFATSFEFSASADVGAATPAGPGLTLAFDQTSVTITGSFSGAPSEVRTVDLLVPMFATFNGFDTFMIGYSTDPVPLVTAVTAAPVIWDGTTGFAPTPALFTVLDWTLVNPTYLATTAGQLTLLFGPGTDAVAPGVMSATVADVPLPAAAPMLLGALGLLGLQRRRRA